jgi:hypothetical protein
MEMEMEMESVSASVSETEERNCCFHHFADLAKPSKTILQTLQSHQKPFCKRCKRSASRIVQAAK